ncbi:MAG TPA: adenylate/guanylate cyclase domain-containing protein, partial [Flavisolibacter sp.]|nr:adenylate/guanylate cyclase domain-containing protein [Flavisolibacter sp.]
EKVGDQLQQMRAWQGIGNVNLQEGQYAAAFDYLNKAKSTAEELGAKVELRDIYQNLSLGYAKVADFQNAYLYKTKYADVKDTIYNTESLKKLGLLNFGFELSKKEDQIKLLTNEKKLGEVEVQKQRQAKTGFAIGLILLIAIAFIIFRGYRHTEKVNKVLDRQKLQIQTLLTNILPAEVVKELQENGRAKPRSYEKVSVLFSDFRNFTMIAEKMSPEELVKELNICFVAFDDIIERNKLEKIKTIGDAYMCAGGIPTVDISHPFRIVKAAVEIQAYMKGFNQRRHELGLEPLEMRIGIHVGPVVAGVVGKKKYAYDIWGNTVNIASRMESNGEPGKINISADTYELIKDKYICTHRGKLYAKNVGEIDMYFVQDEITVPAEAPLAKPAEPLDDVVYAN